MRQIGLGEYDHFGWYVCRLGPGNYYIQPPGYDPNSDNGEKIIPYLRTLKECTVEIGRQIHCQTTR